MTTAHVYFAADVPLSPVAATEVHRSTFVANDDATLQQRQTGDRSISPPAPLNCSSPITASSPRFERNMGFFRQLSRRFGLRSNDDLVYSGSNEDDNQSSSTDSCSSHKGQAVGGGGVKEIAKQFMSSNSSETSSTVDVEEQQLQLQREKELLQREEDSPIANNELNAEDENRPNYHKDRKSFARSSFSRLQRRSTNSIRRAFEAFSLSSRSLSCSGATPPPAAPLLTSQSQSHTSSASSSTNNGTPIKSALKSSSNLELNKKSASFIAATKSSASSFNMGKTAAAATTSSSSSMSSSAAARGASANCNSSSLSSSAASSSSSSKTKTKPPPQRILRQPVSYTYLKGISGLPTQRVPRSSVCCQYVRR